MKNIRIRKQKKPLQVINNWQDNRSEADKSVFDVVLKALYTNSGGELDLEKDIFKASRLKIPRKESVRLWNVLTGSGWVAPSVGFGKAGKVELTKAGYQLMAQFGGYSEYLAAMENNNKPQTIIMPIAIETEGDSKTIELASGDK